MKNGRKNVSSREGYASSWVVILLNNKLLRSSSGLNLRDLCRAFTIHCRYKFGWGARIPRFRGTGSTGNARVLRIGKLALNLKAGCSHRIDHLCPFRCLKYSDYSCYMSF